MEEEIMLPLIRGLISGASPTEISRLMDETTEYNKRITEKRKKIEEEKQAKIKQRLEEEEKIDDLIGGIFERLDGLNRFNGADRTQEIMMDGIDSVCEKMKVDRVVFYNKFKSYLDNYYD
jgi:DNA-binding transcriptional MerR regulator